MPPGRELERKAGQWPGAPVPTSRAMLRGGSEAPAPPWPGPHAACPQTQLIQMVVWMLQRRLLVQLHTYVCLMASPGEDEPRSREDDMPLSTRAGGRSLSTPNALSFGSPSRTPAQGICLVGG